MDGFSIFRGYNVKQGDNKIRIAYNSGATELRYVEFQKIEEVVDDGLVAWYKMDESDSATVVKDYSSNGYDASVVGTPNWDAGNGFVFSGGTASSGNAIKLPDNILAGLDDVSVTFDVLVDPNSLGNAGMFTLGNQTPTAGYLTATAQDGSYRYASTFANGSTTTFPSRKTMWMLPTKVWKSVAVTLKGGETGNNGALTLYEDGVVAASATNITQKPPAASTYNYIGRAQATNNASFKGIIRNFRIYGKELTAEQVADLAEPIVAADTKALSLGNTTGVVTNLTLPVKGFNSTAISWESSDDSVITPNGVITRPESGSSSATLTATISRAGISETKSFVVTVLAKSDAADVAWDAANLAVVNADDIRGDITLPTEGKLGTAISWTSGNPSVVTATGEVNRPAYGEESVKVGLSATITKGSESKTVTIDVTVQPMPRNIPYTAYGMSHFKTNSIDGEKAYLLISEGNNALSWTAVNNGYPILESTLGTMGIRDPFIIRSHEGDKFYLLATDMSYPRFGNWVEPSRTGSTCLVIFESNDLINWSEQRLVKVSPDYVGNLWAPEAYYDDSIGEYVVYWASKFYDNETDPTHRGDSYNRMLYATTRDFVTFSDPVVWYDEPGFNRIDIAVIKEGDTYYRFVKDDADGTPVVGVAPNTTRDIFVEKHTDLRAAPYTEWTPVSEELGRNSMGGTRFGTGYEDPIVIKANPGDVNGQGYYFFADRYIGSQTGYKAAFSDSLDAETWEGMTMTIPANSHHGSVFALKQNEWNTLKGIASDKIASTTSLSFLAGSNPDDVKAIVTVTAADGGQVAGQVKLSAGNWSGTAKLAADGAATIDIPRSVLS